MSQLRTISLSTAAHCLAWVICWNAHAEELAGNGAEGCWVDEPPTKPGLHEPPSGELSPATVHGTRTGTGPVESASQISRTRELPARHRIVYDNLLAARTSPLGLVNRFSLGYRRQLIRRPGALFAESQGSAKLRSNITPAFVTAGPRLEIQPLTILRFAASYQFVQYFRTFGTLQSFPDARAEHSQALLDRRRDAGEHYAARGHQIDLSVLTQAKVGPVIMRNESIFRWSAMDLSEGDRVFHDKLLDTLVPNRGITYIHDFDLLFDLPRRIKVGARWNVVAPMYRAQHFADGQDRVNDFNGPVHRLGPAFLIELFDRPGQRFNQPSLFVLTLWHLRHRYRTGAEFSAAVPTVMAGMLFNGDLWRKH